MLHLDSQLGVGSGRLECASLRGWPGHPKDYADHPGRLGDIKLDFGCVGDGVLSNQMFAHLFW